MEFLPKTRTNFFCRTFPPRTAARDWVSRFQAASSLNTTARCALRTILQSARDSFCKYRSRRCARRRFRPSLDGPPAMKHRILIVDDEEGIRQSLSAILADEGYDAEAVPSGEACLA